MKIKDLKVIPWRIKILVTRKTVWVDRENGSEITIKESWSSAWAIVGIHSYNWWWVRKYGELSCGCTRNPLTRRMVSFRAECRTHMLYPEDLEPKFGADE